MRQIRHIADLGRWLARPVLMFYALPWLMLLLAAGTVAQADIGLYQAHKLYFSSWIVWLGPVPLPGAYPTLGAITLSLTAKFLLGSPWRAARLGTTLTHLGVLLLLYGGLATALTQEEGFLIIAEGASSDEIGDYHRRVLKIYRDDELAGQIPIEQLRAGHPVPGDLLPFRVIPTLICRNCAPDTNNLDDSLPRHGMAEKITLSSLPLEKEDEMNFSGLMFEARGSGDTDGLYVSLEDVPMIPRFEGGEGDDAIYGIQMGRAVTTLPFSIALEDFVKEDYPGTMEAKNYHSDVVVRDGEVEWPARIEMNAPLRYRGYTFYQTSFALAPDGTEKTVLSVVRNQGWLVPYAASAIIFAGLCAHLFQRLAGRKEGP